MPINGGNLATASLLKGMEPHSLKRMSERGDRKSLLRH